MALRHRSRRFRRVYHTNYSKLRERGRRVDRIVGIDGEGQGSYPHRYTYLAASDEQGRTWEVRNPEGLTTEECLDFCLSLPERAVIVGFMFLYDLTKALANIDNQNLYDLIHEDERQKVVFGDGPPRVIFRPIHWRGYSINFVNRQLTIAKGKRRVTIWDVFRFYRSSFVSALVDWKIGDKETLERMAEMKEKRGHFDKLPSEQVEAYCKSECLNLAHLMRALITAHVDAGLELKHYYGAGSTASVLLDKMGIKKKRGIVPKEMRHAVACAFFGGRFENSVVGPVAGPVYNYDINSAYPYHAYFLPCLEHGSWNHSRNPSSRDIQGSSLALIRWTTPRGSALAEQAWGPLPVRFKSGSIAFPLTGVGGWTWKDEFLQAQRFTSVQAVEAWLYHTDCDCQPFKQISHYYLERCKLGKDARGIPFKLAINSVYGKLAQSRGLRPPYQSWIWSGNITSGCRAQLLEAILAASSPWNVLLLATDGVLSRERLFLPAPRDTGTFSVDKPLGGWDSKVYSSGVFCVRPGIYFPMRPTKDQMKEVRARGLGKKNLYKQHKKITRAWRKRECEVKDLEVEIGGLTRFVGMKTALVKTPSGKINRSKDYGEWVPHSVKVTFHPAPKRHVVLPNNRLAPWKWFGFESAPYDEALISPEMKLLALAEQQAEEQPDGGFGEVD